LQQPRSIGAKSGSDSELLLTLRDSREQPVRHGYTSDEEQERGDPAEQVERRPRITDNPVPHRDQIEAIVLAASRVGRRGQRVARH
jgi:hypothetical protein